MIAVTREEIAGVNLNAFGSVPSSHWDLVFHIPQSDRKAKIFPQGHCDQCLITRLLTLTKCHSALNESQSTCQAPCSHLLPFAYQCSVNKAPLCTNSHLSSKNSLMKPRYHYEICLSDELKISLPISLQKRSTFSWPFDSLGNTFTSLGFVR